MCGFLGALSFNDSNFQNIRAANTRLICRGPDNTKQFSDNKELNIDLIFNRLKILDLDDLANQPMLLKDNILMFNGEIYNHIELRKELKSKGCIFKTNHSDTEVILNGLNLEGIHFVKKLIGQFSIAYLNKNQKKLFLIRDRMGQKPLYYTYTNHELYFGSDLIAVSKLSNKEVIREDSIKEYLKLGVVSSPNTIFEAIKKVEPAEILEFGYETNKIKYQKSKFWNLNKYINNQKFNTDEFFDLFNNAINIRNNADVPVANFLSGGLDSTSIVKNQFDQDQNIINTFSVTFDNKMYDESFWSAMVSKKYNTNHTVYHLTKKELIHNIDNSLDSLDEPYADPSVVPSYLLSKLISTKYKVAISGDGGDELLGGYRRVYNSLSYNKFLSNPYKVIYNLYPAFLGTGNFFKSHSNTISQRYKSFLEDEKLLKLLSIEDSKSSIFMEDINDNYKLLLATDYKYFLNEMMMYKVDKTSMANSLEVRSPFVDHRLIEYIFSHDTSYLNFHKPKKILQDYLSADFDTKFTNRTKQGFVFDTKEWVYSNIDKIENQIFNGKIVKDLNPKIVSILKVNKSRINSLRLWKLFVLEKYFSNI